MQLLIIQVLQFLSQNQLGKFSDYIINGSLQAINYITKTNKFKFVEIFFNYIQNLSIHKSIAELFTYLFFV